MERAQCREFFAICQNKLRRNLLRDAAHELRRTCIIDGHGQNPAQHTAEEGSYPFRAVFTPDEDAFTFGNIAPDQLCSETPGENR